MQVIVKVIEFILFGYITWGKVINIQNSGLSRILFTLKTSIQKKRLTYRKKKSELNSLSFLITDPK